MSNFYMTRADFELFVEVCGGEITREPGRSDSNIRVNFDLANGVEMELNLRAINKTAHGDFYGTNQGWTHVRFSTWAWENTSFRGKGSRSNETHQLAKAILAYTEGFDMTNRSMWGWTEEEWAAYKSGDATVTLPE